MSGLYLHKANQRSKNGFSISFAVFFRMFVFYVLNLKREFQKKNLDVIFLIFYTYSTTLLNHLRNIVRIWYLFTKKLLDERSISGNGVNNFRNGSIFWFKERNFLSENSFKICSTNLLHLSLACFAPTIPLCTKEHFDKIFFENLFVEQWRNYFAITHKCHSQDSQS